MQHHVKCTAAIWKHESLRHVDRWCGQKRALGAPISEISQARHCPMVAAKGHLVCGSGPLFVLISRRRDLPRLAWIWGVPASSLQYGIEQHGIEQHGRRP